MALQIGIGGKTGARPITAARDERGLSLSVRDPSRPRFMAGADAGGLHLSVSPGATILSGYWHEMETFERRLAQTAPEW